ncbi:arginine deiminase [Clostridium grantii]|uniref:Arginine deiminase n=1 Tax=Clostridium grantii DSM 8605 TaxID=1121316 RepID=A0A1M5XQL3_9CLOT|nr:arginine deiminase [Clostridium grantii]SHI02127.1 arginine deiminase [Clostridium grantii DSM 8605]
MNSSGINVYSEIGNLKKVLLHEPGNEIENLTPNYLELLLFDDIPYLKVAKKEHKYFADVLKNNNVEILYLENLVAESLVEENIKKLFIQEVLLEGRETTNDEKNVLTEYLNSLSVENMVLKVMSGVRRKEVGYSEEGNNYPFLMNPMPNLYFTRDPFAIIGSGVSINTMKTNTRKRETIFGKYIFNHHKDYKDANIKRWYDRNNEYCIEGGDQLILSKDVLAIGHSERTDKEAIIRIAKNIFNNNEEFKTILMFEIPKTRAFMHLDTVFTMLDYDKFTVHPAIEGKLKVNAIYYEEDNKLKIIEEEDSLDKILAYHLNRDITLIRCGGGDKIAAAREQWNDGSNTLAIAPGKVITYERNYITNELLDKNNISVIPIVSSELSRGRGGPRCMSMPFYREDI